MQPCHDRHIKPHPKKLNAVHIRSANLHHQRLPQRMMAIDQVRITTVQAFQKFWSRYMCKFSALTAITVPTCQNEVPNAVRIRHEPIPL